MAKRILIIDDERDMQIYLRTLFRRAGYETAVAHNGEEGLRRALSFKPDLITLDLLMPRKSGVIAFESLRTCPETLGVPIVIVTGMAQHEDLLRSDRPEVRPPEAVVDKPIDRDTLLQTVGELVGGTD